MASGPDNFTMTDHGFEKTANIRLGEQAGAARLVKALVRRGLEREHLAAAAAIALALDDAAAESAGHE